MATKQEWLQYSDDNIEYFKRKLSEAKELKKKIKQLPPGEVTENPLGDVSTQDSGGDRPPTPPPFP